MTDSRIAFAVQSGGMDAHAAIKPIAALLRNLAKDFHLRGITLLKLVFMLRVDGSVSEYDVTTPVENLDVNKRKGYLSVDIGIRVEEREYALEKIINCMLVAPEFIRSQPSSKSLEIDYEQLSESIIEFCSLVKSAKV